MFHIIKIVLRKKNFNNNFVFLTITTKERNMILIGKSKIDMSELWSAYAFKNVGDWRIHDPETVPHSGAPFKHSVENERWADDYIAVQERGLAAVFGTPPMDDQTFLQRTRKYFMPEIVDGKIVAKEMTAQTYPTLIWPSKSPYDATGKSMYVFSLYGNTPREFNVSNGMSTVEIPINSYQTSNLYKVQYSWSCDSDFGTVIYYGSEIWPYGYLNVVTGTDEARTMQKDIDNQVEQNENWGYIAANNTPRGVLYWLCERMKPGTDMTSYDDTYKNYHNAKLHEEGTPDSKIVLLIYPNPEKEPRTITYTIYNQWDQFRAINTETAPITITIKQAANSVSFDNSVIQYYTANTLTAPITSTYGPASADGGNSWVYFKIIGKDALGNNVYYGSDPTHSASNISYGVTLGDSKLTVNKIEFDSLTNIWSMRFMYPANAAGGMKVEGNIAATCDGTAECTEGAESIINITEHPKAVPVATPERNATVKVALKEYPSNYATATYSQYGKDGETVPLTYGYNIIQGSEYATVNDSGKVIWKANNGDERTVTVTVYCIQDPKIATNVICKQGAGTDISYSPNDKEATGGKIPYIMFYLEESATNEAISYNLNNYVPNGRGYLGGDGDIFFKIVGFNKNGVEGYYGEHPNETSEGIKLTFTRTFGDYTAFLVVNSLEYNSTYHTWRGKVHWEPNIKYSEYVKGTPTLSYKTVAADDTNGVVPTWMDAEISTTVADNRNNAVSCELLGWDLKKSGVSYIQETNNDRNAPGVVKLTHKSHSFFVQKTDIAVTIDEKLGYLFWPVNEGKNSRQVTVNLVCVYSPSDGSADITVSGANQATQYGIDDAKYDIVFNSGEGGILTEEAAHEPVSFVLDTIEPNTTQLEYTGTVTYAKRDFMFSSTPNKGRIAKSILWEHLSPAGGNTVIESLDVYFEWTDTHGKQQTDECHNVNYGHIEINLDEVASNITFTYRYTLSEDAKSVSYSWNVFNIFEMYGTPVKKITPIQRTIKCSLGETPDPPFIPVNEAGEDNTGWEPDIEPVTGPAKYTAVWEQPQPEPTYTDEISVIVNITDGVGSGEASIPSGRYAESAGIYSYNIIEDDGLSERLSTSRSLMNGAYKIYINVSCTRADGSTNGLNGVEEVTVYYVYHYID